MLQTATVVMCYFYVTLIIMAELVTGGRWQRGCVAGNSTWQDRRGGVLSVTQEIKGPIGHEWWGVLSSLFATVAFNAMLLTGKLKLIAPSSFPSPGVVWTAPSTRVSQQASAAVTAAVGCSSPGVVWTSLEKNERWGCVAAASAVTAVAMAAVTGV